MNKLKRRIIFGSIVTFLLVIYLATGLKLTVVSILLNDGFQGFYAFYNLVGLFFGVIIFTKAYLLVEKDLKELAKPKEET